MSLIEQAAKRLAELQRAGAELPDPKRASPGSPGEQAANSVPTPEALVRQINLRKEVLAAGETLPEPARGVDTPPQAEKRIAGPKLKVEIDLARLLEQGFVTPDSPQSTIAHELRVLKRPIIRNARGGPSAPAVANGMLVMVTSAIPGEGKTFTACNLAISMAMEFDNTVMLVDGDVAHPSVLNVFGLPPSPGLLDLLTRDDLEIDDVLLQTNLERLTLLPAGSRHRRATELLASERMVALLQKLSRTYPDRIIIFDSPPLLATTEARVLATHMGQIVMVVAAESTSKHAVNHALATIERCDVVMMLLNKAVMSGVGSYYGYYGYDLPD